MTGTVMSNKAQQGALRRAAKQDALSILRNLLGNRLRGLRSLKVGQSPRTHTDTVIVDLRADEFYGVGSRLPHTIHGLPVEVTTSEGVLEIE